MKIHTTNYYNTFIEVAEDCLVQTAEIPPQKGDEKTIAALQFEIISNNPYKYTSDEVLFRIYALKKGIAKADLDAERRNFFSKGQPCFRSSPLAKRYGWGIHSDDTGKIAIYAKDSDEYKERTQDKNLKILKAMRSSRK